MLTKRSIIAVITTLITAVISALRSQCPSNPTSHPTVSQASQYSRSRSSPGRSASTVVNQGEPALAQLIDDLATQVKTLTLLQRSRREVREIAGHLEGVLQVRHDFVGTHFNASDNQVLVKVPPGVVVEIHDLVRAVHLRQGSTQEHDAIVVVAGEASIILPIEAFHVMAISLLDLRPIREIHLPGKRRGRRSCRDRLECRLVRCGADASNFPVLEFVEDRGDGDDLIASIHAL